MNLLAKVIHAVISSGLKDTFETNKHTYFFHKANMIGLLASEFAYEMLHEAQLS